MKITNVSSILLSFTYPSDERPRFAGGQVLRRNAALVRVDTDEGLSGLGEVGSAIFIPEAVQTVVAKLKGLILEEDPFNIERIWQKMYASSAAWGRRGLGMGAISGIEVALWDVVGKAMSTPVYQMLGGLYHDRIRAYASLIPQPREQLVAQFKVCVDQGFTAVKIKLGAATYPGGGGLGMGVRPSLDRERELVQAAREAVGPDVDLMVDAAQAVAPEPWPVPTVIEVAKMLEEFDAFWLEKPCGADNLDGHAAVATAVDIPVAAGENLATRFEFKQWMERGAVDIIQPDVVIAGGLLECKKIAALASAYNIPIAPHMWWTGVGMMANLHFTASTPGCIIAEYPQVTYPLREELLEEPLSLQDGYLRLPAVPGLGVRLTDEIIEKYPFQPGPTWQPDGESA
jgi:L-alanine-DL-glutamate epimerase-like enolase superfamily enzyme